LKGRKEGKKEGREVDLFGVTVLRDRRLGPFPLMRKEGRRDGRKEGWKEGRKEGGM
jgi:hypothetical protein